MTMMLFRVAYYDANDETYHVDPIEADSVAEAEALFDREGIDLLGIMLASAKDAEAYYRRREWERDS